jgi:hypothetical protein
MIALVLLLAAASPQDSDRLRKFERSVASDRDDHKNSGDDRKKDRQEPSPCPDTGRGWTPSCERTSSVSEHSPAEFFFYPFYDHGRRFERYPFAQEEPYFSDGDHSEKTMAVHFASTAGWIERGLWSVGAEAVLSWSSGCDVRFDVLQFMEEVEGGTDRLTLTQAQLNFAVTPDLSPLNFTIGFGVGSLEGEIVSETGVTLQANLEWHILQPVSLRLYGGIIGFEDASVTDLRAELGIHFHRFAVTAGVRSLISSGGEDLTGPTLGLAIFF